MQLVAGHDVRDRLGSIKVPALFIASRRDRLQNSILEAELMATSVPVAKIRIVEEAGHVLTPSHKCSLRSLLSEASFL
jgi:pimeloyl-ACP methyl ester carboxylesterase